MNCFACFIGFVQLLKCYEKPFHTYKMMANFCEVFLSLRNKPEYDNKIIWYSTCCCMLKIYGNTLLHYKYCYSELVCYGISKSPKRSVLGDCELLYLSPYYGLYFVISYYPHLSFPENFRQVRCHTTIRQLTPYQIFLYLLADIKAK